MPRVKGGVIAQKKRKKVLKEKGPAGRLYFMLILMPLMTGKEKREKKDNCGLLKLMLI